MAKNFTNIRAWTDYGGRQIKYFAEISHSQLNESKVLSASSDFLLKDRVNQYLDRLETKWEKQIEEQKKLNGEQAANFRTKNAVALLESIEKTLNYTLEVNDNIIWSKLKIDNINDSLIKPSFPQWVDTPNQPTYVNPIIGFFDNIFPNRKRQKLDAAALNYGDQIKVWEKDKSDIEKVNRSNKEEYDKEMEIYENRSAEISRQINSFKEEYFKLRPDAVESYVELVLNKSKYPDFFSQRFEIEYKEDSKILLIDYFLPNPSSLPTLNSVKYISSRKEFRETHISSTQRTKLYDSLIYQIILRTVHEIFESDQADAINAVSFNGWVNFINPSTGKDSNSCIASIQTTKESFLEIDLSKVDPKSCFKSLKGIGASSMSTVTAVQPIILLNKSDRRFTDHYEVAHTINDSVNLATMDWEDFEHLVREVFAAEFNQGGGEVKITRASRDGGVDAVAFDPDPIRGGKTVIQAKRYTNTVGVSAVRDLYGTVMNEGAMKGILVTTADYGPDAYEFAKGKPLTLLNGSNLLHLMEKHGHKAKIDIKEAKRLKN